MDHAPLNRITRNSRWKNRVLFGLLPLALLLTGALVFGALRILDQEKFRLELDFKTLTIYLAEQEAFLQQLRERSHDIEQVPMERMGQVQAIRAPSNWDVQLYEAQESVVDMPFSMACVPAYLCPTANRTVLALGGYLADFYASFWASSYFPAAAVFFISRNEGISVSVPGIGTFAGYEPVSVNLYRAVTEAAREAVLHHQVSEQVVGERVPKVVWLSVPGLPNKMIGMVPAGFAQGLWRSAVSTPSDIFVATLFSRDRLYALQQRDESGPLYAFWLSHQAHGPLIGSGAPPQVEHNGLSLSAQGLVWRGQDAEGRWTGIYVIPYGSFFSGHKLWLLSTGTAVLLVLLGVAWYARWYRRTVVAPALQAQRQIIESEEFNRTLIETAPVGLCVLHRSTGEVVFCNSIAEQWLDPQRGSSALMAQLQSIRTQPGAGMLDQVGAPHGCALSVAYAPSMYRDQQVMVCAFTDLSSRLAIEQELARAKHAADEASAAKSLFLSTMSHEIRTPLHGLQGTLELLATTALNPRQRQYVGRIEEASKLLLQLISDILDMSRIEAGQLSLECKPFNMLELVHSCVGSYAAMAQRKGLLLYACVDPAIPALLEGDAVRLRQILNNLISNAIKFTHAGKVVVTVQVLGSEAGQVRLDLQVCDSGVGISAEHQAKLFQPFFTAEGNNHTFMGTGLGLSICQRLAVLMGTHMRVHSAEQLGSCFACELALPVVAHAAFAYPQLEGCQLWVRTPHPQLSRNICAWLQRWGAQAEVGEAVGNAQVHTRRSAWLDVLTPCAQVPAGWTGLYICLDPVEGVSTHPDWDGHSVLSIGRGLEQLLLQKTLAPAVPAHQVALSLRVLVAEDNPINQMTLRDQLEELGCQVTLADDGEDALALWDMEPHDVVLTDVNMPRMNGYELAKTLRAEGVRCPIVGITANAMRDEEQRCLDAGMDVCVVKPIQLHALAQLLQPMAVPVEQVPLDHPAAQPVELLVPEKYRALFVQTMQEDLRVLTAALQAQASEQVVFALHRMSGGLMTVNYVELAQGLQDLEKQVVALGLHAENTSDIWGMIEKLGQYLVKVDALTTSK